jgi:hypothetical protein
MRFKVNVPADGRRLDEPMVRVDESSYRLFLVRCGIDTHRGGWRAARFG